MGQKKWIIEDRKVIGEAMIGFNKYFTGSNKNKIYFHIGFGKTGSSALQSYLSFNSEHGFQNSKGKLLYCSFKKNGDIVFGDKLKEEAERSSLKYIASDPEIAQKWSHRRTRQQLSKILKAGYTPLFSQEDWGRRAGEFLSADMFSKLNCTVHLIVYVRPQVEWFNSGWWQWWAWSDAFKKPVDVINAWGFEFMLWADQINKWKNIPNVEGVTVRVQSSDIVEDFLRIFDVAKNIVDQHEARNNTSLSPMLIKLLLALKGIRDVHFADVDTILSKYITFEGKSPWMIDSCLSESIINATKNDNILLMSMLSDENRDKMRHDPRWWDKEYYSGREVWKEEDFELTQKDMYEILKQAIPTLIELGRKVNRI